MSTAQKKPVSSVADLRRMTARDIVRKPVITEKSMGQSSDAKYTFEVDLRANKIQIRHAIESIFGVTVTKVTTCRTPGKERRANRKDSGFTPETKKATVSLIPGQQIELDGKPLFEV